MTLITVGLVCLVIVWLQGLLGGLIAAYTRWLLSEAAVNESIIRGEHPAGMIVERHNLN